MVGWTEQQTGCTVRDDSIDEEVALFNFYWDEIMSDICQTTNVKIQQENNSNKRFFVKELQVFIGITILMSYSPQAKIKDYWTKSNESKGRLVIYTNDLCFFD